MNRANSRRSGYVMVLLAMLFFGLMALAALVIDLGFARLTQRQMQTAADAAALEGLRGEGIALRTYEDRQDAAETFITLTFDDNLDPTDGDQGPAGEGGAFGAGPNVTLSGGVRAPELQAGQLLSVDSNQTVYDPVVLRGTENPGQFQVELQRGTTNTQADLFSHGPTVPFLFARGSLMDRNRIAANLCVGATSTAQSRPAVSVGPPIGAVPGIVPIAYAVEDWGAAPVNPVLITSNLTGGLSIGQTLVLGGPATLPPSGYCAIFDSTTFRVIGFGLLGQPSPIEGVVAERNATAHFIAAGPSLAALSSSERDAVLSANQGLSHALTAPVLVEN